MVRRRITCPALPVVVLAALAVASAARAAENAEYRYAIAYATYLGGSEAEQLREVIPAEDGSVLVGGQTNSPDLPVTAGALQSAYGGEPAGTGHPGVYGGDCWLARLSPDGRKILAATYFGGSKQERNVYGMALDRQGRIVIASATRSPDLPTTEGAFQRRYGGGPSDWAVAKLAPDLTRVLWCTYVGGSGDDFPRGGLAVDGEDYVYVVGGTTSPDFPTTPGVFQTDRRGERDAAIVKLKPDGTGLVFGTLLGGNGWDGLMGIRVDEKGSIHVAGHTQSTDFPGTSGGPQPKHGGKSDAYLAGLSPDAARLLYATYLGGAENEFAEHRPFLAADGTVLLAGVTSSADFPTTPEAFQRSLKGRTDGFLTALAKGGKAWGFSTLLGGSEGEFYLMPTPDARGNLVLVGMTESKDFPVTAGAVQKTHGGGKTDGALAILSPDGRRLLYATYLGGSGEDLIRSLAVTPKGEVYLVGSTSSSNFPVSDGAAGPKLRGPSDAFVVKLVPAP